MQNLAGHPESTRHCRDELSAAGVPVVVLDAPHGEPKSWVGGELNGFTFRRAWLYWVVEGRMPIEVARRLYDDPVGRREVRVAGHCQRPPPDDWTTWYDADGREICLDPAGVEERRWVEFTTAHPRLLAGADVPRFVRDMSEVPDAREYVTSYHVDGAEGLRLLADAVRGLTDR